jgi:hypothetical protein
VLAKQRIDVLGEPAWIAKLECLASMRERRERRSEAFVVPPECRREPAPLALLTVLRLPVRAWAQAPSFGSLKNRLGYRSRLPSDFLTVRDHRSSERSESSAFDNWLNRDSGSCGWVEAFCRGAGSAARPRISSLRPGPDLASTAHPRPSPNPLLQIVAGESLATGVNGRSARASETRSSAAESAGRTDDLSHLLVCDGEALN